MTTLHAASLRQLAPFWPKAWLLREQLVMRSRYRRHCGVSVLHCVRRVSMSARQRTSRKPGGRAHHGARQLPHLRRGSQPGRSRSNRIRAGRIRAGDQAFEDALAGMRDSGLTGWILASCLDWMAAELGKAGDLLAAAKLFG